MAVLFSILLVASVLGIIALLALKQFELSTGAVILGAARPSVGRFFHSTLVWVEHTLPRFFAHLGVFVYRRCRTWVQQALARSILWFEKTLETLLFTVKEKTRAPRGAGQVSAFLREIADHKHKLSKELQQKERMIVDEE